MTAEQRACTIVADALKIQGTVDANDSVATLSTWDSLGHMTIVFSVEEALGRQLAAEEIAMLTSVQSIASLLDGD